MIGKIKTLLAIEDEIYLDKIGDYYRHFCKFGIGFLQGYR